MRKMIILLLSVLSILVILSIGTLVFKRISPIGLGMHKPFYHTSGIAIDGYDVTTYFSGNIQKGNEKFAENWQGAKWLFASKENQLVFKENPDKYLPEYGGYCTKAVSTGFTAPSDPTIYTVHEDKLYIFSNLDLKKEFEQDPISVKNACEKKWK